MVWGRRWFGWHRIMDGDGDDDGGLAICGGGVGSGVADVVSTTSNLFNLNLIITINELTVFGR